MDRWNLYEDTKVNNSIILNVQTEGVVLPLVRNKQSH